MAEDILQKVLERAFTDQGFRARLESELEETLSAEGYNLSPEARLQLKGILDEGREAFATGLDQRLSQSGVSLSPQALLRAKSKVAAKTEFLEEKGSQAFSMAREKKTRKELASAVRDGVKDVPEKLGSFEDDEPDYEVETD